MAENSNVVINIVDDCGYKKDKPPVDDCCPICCDSFKIPCQTNCGHWYCGGCFLQLWRHTEDGEWCKCPMCGCAVKKLTPYSSKLVPPEEDRQKILKDIRGYNYQNVRRWFAFFLDVLIAMLLPIRRLPPEDNENIGTFRGILLFVSIYNPCNLILGLASLLSRFSFMPSWYWEFILFTWLFSYVIWIPLMIYILCDEIWLRPRRHARELAQALALHVD